MRVLFGRLFIVRVNTFALCMGSFESIVFDLTVIASHHMSLCLENVTNC